MELALVLGPYGTRAISAVSTELDWIEFRPALQSNVLRTKLASRRHLCIRAKATGAEHLLERPFLPMCWDRYSSVPAWRLALRLAGV